MPEQTEAIRKLKSLKKASPMGIAKEVSSLFAYIELFDLLFVFVFIFALLKDFSDIFISLIPIVGLALSLMISALCAIFIFLMMFLIGAGANKKIAQRMVVIFVGTFADSLPLVNFLPVETIVVVVTFLMILMERKEKAAEQKQQKKEPQKETQEAYA